MDIKTVTVLIKGGGDLGSGVAWRLFSSGFKVAVVDLPLPMCVRRQVSFSTAITEGSLEVEGVQGKFIKDNPDFNNEFIPVFTTEQKDILDKLNPTVLVDATLKAIDNRTTTKGDAPLTIGLGPGFKAPGNIDCVIETNQGNNMGKVIWDGEAEKYTGIPINIEGYTSEILLRAPADGKFTSLKKIGDNVEKNELIGWVSRKELRAGVHGMIRGLIADGTRVKNGYKMGDIDPRGGWKECVSTISDKARSVGEGVLEAILHWLSRQKT